MYALVQWYLRAMVGLLLVLAGFHLIPFSILDISIHVLVVVVLCYLWNQLFARIFKVTPNDESQYITGLILSLIFTPLPFTQEIGFLVGLTGIAMGSKYLIAIRHRHFLNPAMTAAVLSAIFLGQTASWWVASIYTLPLTIVGGLILFQKLRRWQLWLSFLVSYAIVLSALLLIQGTNAANLGSLLVQIFVFSPVLFFLYVMVPEPLTSPSTDRGLTIYGFVIGASLAMLQLFAPQIAFSLELSLIIGNVVTRIWYPNTNALLTLKRREPLGDGIVGLWFAPVPPFTFTAGQFLEMTLPHHHIDTRGIRRHFTIASAPTESEILVAVKYSDPGSSFKATLKSLIPGDHVLMNQVGGSFTLPKDPLIPLVFIAGGIGVTPFRSMLKWLTDQKQHRTITLFYAAKTPDEFVFEDLLKKAETIGLRTIKVLSDNPPKDWSGEVGRIDTTLIRKHVKNLASHHVFVSGPEPLVEALSSQLRTTDLPHTNLHRDFFPGYKETYQKTED